MVVNDSNLVPIKHPKFYCSYCDFTCSKKAFGIDILLYENTQLVVKR